MDAIATAAKWVASHPWRALAALLFVAATLSLIGQLCAVSRRRKSSTVRLRTPKGQARFNPTTAVYTPKQYRRPRKR